MELTISAQTVITASAFAAALCALLSYGKKLMRWVDRQDKQDKKLASICDEQSLLTYGVLACLRGLQEQGCDGAVTAAIEKIEKHLNIEAHKTDL